MEKMITRYNVEKAITVIVLAILSLLMMGVADSPKAEMAERNWVGIRETKGDLVISVDLNSMYKKQALEGTIWVYFDTAAINKNTGKIVNVHQRHVTVDNLRDFHHGGNWDNVYEVWTEHGSFKISAPNCSDPVSYNPTYCSATRPEWELYTFVLYANGMISKEVYVNWLIRFADKKNGTYVRPSAHRLLPTY